MYLTLRGLNFKNNLEHLTGKGHTKVYPSVDIFVPAYNEGVVIADTLHALSKLNYKGVLDVYILNDMSTDETGDICDEYSKAFKNIHHVVVPDGRPKGKSRVLNHALSVSNGELFVVYDGDNQPQPDAVQLLVDAMLREPEAVGCVGTVRTINADSNILTRMIAIEFQVFQLTLQAGRWVSQKVGSLPGTNMLLKRQTVLDLGGYDEKALAEDAELTVRLAADNKIIVVEPRAVTWEQEPENLKVLIKQRTRWLQGNLYLALKFIKQPSWWRRKCIYHLIHYMVVYIIFPIILVPCNILFVLGILGVVNIHLKIPFMLLWYLSYYIYTIQIIMAQWYDKTLTVKNFLIGCIMYFTYAQLFMVIFTRALIVNMKSKKNRQVHWDKTARVKNKKA